MIDIEHPGTGGKATVTERAFQNVWKAKGWRRAHKKSAAAAPPAGSEDNPGRDASPQKQKPEEAS